MGRRTTARYAVPRRRGNVAHRGVEALGGPRLGHRDDEVVADDGGDGGLVENGARPLVGVVGVDGDIRAAGQQDGHDRDVEVDRAGPDSHADLGAGADAD